MKRIKNDCRIYILYAFLLVCIFFISPVQAQDKTHDDWEMPQEISVINIEETNRQLDSTINQTKKQLEKAIALQQKGQLLLQTHRIKEAKKIYQQGLKILKKEDFEVTIKILTGLGEIADLEGDQEKAASYFTEAYTKIKIHKSISGLLWILYHEGENYITPKLFSISELKAVLKFAGRYLYSKPQLTLAASHWLFENSGDNVKITESGHIFAGLVYRDWGQFDKALAQFYKAIEVNDGNVYEDRSKYAALLNIAAVHDMQGEREKSLDIIKKVAKDAEKDGDDFGLAYALKDIGITLMQDGKDEAAISYLLKCIPVMQKLNDIRGQGVCYSNLANAYLELKNYTKTQESITKALKLLKASNYDQLYASTLLIRATMYEKLGKWEEAKIIASKGLTMLKKINSLEHIIQAYHLYINYYTYKNDVVMVKKYTDSVLEVNKKYYEKSRLFESENLKIRYETEKKEVQLNIQKKLNTVLQEEASLHKRLRNTMFFILVLSAVVLLLFFNKYRLQNKLVAEREKRNVLEKKQLQETMNHKQRELASMTLQMLKKNELLQELSHNVKKLERKSGKDSKEEVKKLKDMLQSQHRLDQDWSTFKVHFDGVHPNFFEKLSQIANLTQQDIRHCCYIRMGLATKEIAQLMSISASSVQMARYRLKKKIGFNKENDIYEYINKL